MDPRLAGRTARLLEPLHALGYFAPEVEAEVTGVGVRKGRAAYFASRAAAMGRVGAGPVAATFYVFNVSLVRRPTAAPSPAVRSTQRTPTSRGRTSRTWCSSTRSPCSASTVATGTWP